MFIPPYKGAYRGKDIHGYGRLHCSKIHCTYFVRSYTLGRLLLMSHQDATKCRYSSTKDTKLVPLVKNGLPITIVEDRERNKMVIREDTVRPK